MEPTIKWIANQWRSDCGRFLLSDCEGVFAYALDMQSGPECTFVPGTAPSDPGIVSLDEAKLACERLKAAAVTP